MPWFKVDDGFHGHPKVVELSLGAVGLWTLAGSWCAKYLTDGLVPEKTVTRLGGNIGQANELVSVALWSLERDGYAFKDWKDYQPLKEDVEAERAAAQERMRIVRSKKKGVGSPERTANVQPNFGGTSEEVRLTPSHPIPSHPIPLKERPAKRGSRLSEGWLPTAESVAVAKRDAPDVDHKAEHPTFVDYWIAQPGQKGVKTNWDATWRNWMRRKQGDVAKASKPRQTAAQRNMSTVEYFAQQQLEVEQ